MWKAPGEVKHVDQRPRDEKKEAIKVDAHADSRHIQRWTAGDAGRERFDTKEKRELDISRAQQDKASEKLHAQFDLSAQDTHMKYERASFVVVTSSKAFRDGWEETFGEKPTEEKEQHGNG